ncbi:Uncharacterised protein [Vibrio cholerae]|nr:Uncharacterised protein [Vibrio cholerae]
MIATPYLLIRKVTINNTDEIRHQVFRRGLTRA